MSKKRRRISEAHVRLYRHELDCEAYRTLSTDARALLVEMRALFKGEENRIFMSREQIERRLNVGRRVAERARDELIDRGWVRVLERGSFSRKVKHATVYALTNEPLSRLDGDTPPKDFMRWRRNAAPPSKDRVVHDVPRRGTPRTPKQGEEHQKFASRGTPCTPPEQKSRRNVVRHVPTDKLPGAASVLMAAFQASGREQLNLCLLSVALMPGERA